MNMKKRALISVSDKTGIVELAQEIVACGYEIISTGGTAITLQNAGIKCIGISDITSFPECLDGRVKTLHPNVHAGLLAMRANKEHMEQLEKLNINTIDMVVVNLYPFKETIMKPNVELQDAIENIDIGGPTMLRSAAKNYQDVTVLVDPADYGKALAELKNGGVTLETKFYLMYKVYQHTAVYDTMISAFMREKLNIKFPEIVSFAYEKSQDMRYGENPHQSAVFYKEMLPTPGAVSMAKQLHGKELSFNNINDSNGALDLLREFTEPTIVAVKHANPCGVSSAKDIATAFERAYNSDPVSVFGGIIAANREIDLATAEQISKIFIEIVIAPSFSSDAFKILSEKKNIRLLQLDTINAAIPASSFDMKKVVGGLLVQDHDVQLYNETDIKVVTTAMPTKAQLENLKFAMKVVKHTRSNAIVVVDNKTTLGVGAGQVNRIWATKQAIEHSLTNVSGGVLASDAFFPFNDIVDECHKAGIKAIIQPGGSVRDQDSIDACNKYGIAMVFTNMRHFKH